jgi:hypothetical protein
VLDRLLDGLYTIGADPVTAWRVVEAAALDSIPALRREAMMALLAARGDEVPTSAIATTIGYPTKTTERTLEDLAAHGVAVVNRHGQGKATTWEISDWTAESWAAATSPEKSAGIDSTSPEKSGDTLSKSACTHTDDLSGEVYARASADLSANGAGRVIPPEPAVSAHPVNGDQGVAGQARADEYDGLAATVEAEMAERERAS